LAVDEQGYLSADAAGKRRKLMRLIGSISLFYWITAGKKPLERF
jgi:hypothetical protein